VSTAYISDQHPDTRGRLQEESRFDRCVYKIVKNFEQEYKP